MGQNIRCLECEELYPVMVGNVTIFGPIITIKCPFCKHVTEKNFSAFVYEQVKENENLLSIQDAMKMHELAKNIEKTILDII